MREDQFIRVRLISILLEDKIDVLWRDRCPLWTLAWGVSGEVSTAHIGRLCTLVQYFVSSIIIVSRALGRGPQRDPGKVEIFFSLCT